MEESYTLAEADEMIKSYKKLELLLQEYIKVKYPKASYTDFYVEGDKLYVQFSNKLSGCGCCWEDGHEEITFPLGGVNV